MPWCSALLLVFALSVNGQVSAARLPDALKTAHDAKEDIENAIRRGDLRALRVIVQERRQAVDALLADGNGAEGISAALAAAHAFENVLISAAANSSMDVAVLSELSAAAEHETLVIGYGDVVIAHGPPKAPDAVGSHFSMRDLHMAAVIMRQPHARMLRGTGRQGGRAARALLESIGGDGEMVRLHLPHATLHALASADNVPVHGLLRNGTLYADPLTAPAACEAMGNSSAAEVRVAGPQRRAPLPPPALRCAYGAETIMVRSQEELLTRAKRDYDSAVATKLAANMPRGVAGQARKQRRRNPQLAAAEPLGVEPGHSHAQLRRLAEDGSVDRMVAYDGASGSLVPLSQLLGASLRRDTAGGRVLFTPTSQAAGVRTFLPLRTRWTNSADSAAMSQVSLANSLANLARMFSTQSYGAMTPAFANNTACVYPLLTVNSTNNNDYSKFYNEAVVVARNHSDPACRYEPSAFSHVMIIHQNAPVGYGGLGACPGSSTWYNGITAEWMLMHELGHNVSERRFDVWVACSRYHLTQQCSAQLSKVVPQLHALSHCLHRCLPSPPSTALCSSACRTGSPTTSRRVRATSTRMRRSPWAQRARRGRA